MLGLIGCGEMDSLSQFSKRKYLQKTPKQKTIDLAAVEKEVYASADLTPVAYILEEMPEVDDGRIILEQPNKRIEKRFKPVLRSPKVKNSSFYIPKDKKFNLFTLGGLSLYSGLAVSAYLISMKDVIISSTTRIIGVSVLIIGFIMVTIGFIKAIKNPNKYKGRKFSKGLFLASLIAIAVVLSGALFFFLLYG